MDSVTLGVRACADQRTALRVEVGTSSAVSYTMGQAETDLEVLCPSKEPTHNGLAHGPTGATQPVSAKPLL